ncbi:MAG: HEPN domain-containing protein [bacterium]
MNLTRKQIQEIIDYWHAAGFRDWKTAQSLWELKRYDACLFFCHLTIEKLLKGLVVIKTKEPSPYIHNLEKLAHLAEITLSAETINNLRTITEFNIAGRYDDKKFAFYKKCTKNYSKKYLEISKKIIIWLKKEYQKN